MTGKCPNCGYEYGEYDIYCARCGTKIKQNNSQNSEQNEELNKTIDSFVGNYKPSKTEYFDSNAKNNNALLGYLIFLIVVISIFSLSLNFFLSKQTENKLKLQYKNMMNKPELIPELKEPKNYSELSDNLTKTEQFLSLYLKYSTDSKEKKQQIFINYLNEINKIPHITSENMIDENIKECNSIKSSAQAKLCSSKLNKKFKNTGAKAYNDLNIVYLYPDYKNIKKKYSKYINKNLKDYLALKAKYSAPSSVGLNLNITPKKLANKIYDWEKVFNTTQDDYIKDDSEYIIYNDFRKFIFTPSIYATTTQEMKKDFKEAYLYFIKTKKDSNLAPVVMSYLDKQKEYSEENFKNDYPYKIFEKTFEETVQDSSLQDIFSQLRNTLFSQNTKTDFKYIYNTIKNTWSEFKKGTTLRPVEYVITEIDENNNILIYNSTLSLFQELVLPKYSNLFLVNSKLYIYNKDRLSISKINFNSKSFNIANMSTSDITSIFPGVNVINIDNYSSYNIYLEKDNAKEAFIIISKYTQGWQNYSIQAIKGQITQTILPNMFVVNSLNDVDIALRSNDIDSQTSESAPTYLFRIHTMGQQSEVPIHEQEIIQYDEKTNNEAPRDEHYKPVIKPKIGDNDNKIKEDKSDEDLLNSPPAQNIEPPEEN